MVKSVTNRSLRNDVWHVVNKRAKHEQHAILAQDVQGLVTLDIDLQWHFQKFK